MISRRAWIAACCSLLPGFVRGIRSHASPVIPASVRLDLAHIWIDSALYNGATGLAISPDGTRLCLEFWKKRGSPSAIVEIGTWKTLFETTLGSRGSSAAFFSDGNRVLLGNSARVPEGPQKGRFQTLETTINLRTGGRSARFRTSEVSGHTYENIVAPLWDDIMIATRVQFIPHYEHHDLRLLQLPDYREIVRVPYAVGPRPQLPRDFDEQLSHDRKSLVSSYDNVLVYRRTKDLGVLWTAPIDMGVNAYKVAISATGNCVAAACADTPFRDRQRRSYIAIFDGQSGKETARLPFNGTDGLTLSPDGELLAIDSPERTPKKDQVQTMVRLIECSSGRILDSVVHDVIKGRNTFLREGCNLTFTSDGQYLVTSGMLTKVWRVHS